MYKQCVFAPDLQPKGLLYNLIVVAFCVAAFT
jgi:hypothetical protein